MRSTAWATALTAAQLGEDGGQVKRAQGPIARADYKPLTAPPDGGW